jgi:uncharacterized protein
VVIEGTDVKVTDERIVQVRDLLSKVMDWATEQPDVAAVGLVGSWAQDDARMDSDVDVVLLTTVQGKYLQDGSWVTELGGLRVVKTEQWGALTERRFVLPSGLEVEMGIASPSWAATDPVDRGTRWVVEDGMHIIFDPDGLLTRLVDTCRIKGGQLNGTT